MKRLLAFLILLSHMNFSMFMPQVDEVDQYYANGVEVDDINSLVEYIDQVILGHKDDSPEDEDDDNERYLQVVKIDPYSFKQHSDKLKNPYSYIQDKNKFPPYIEQGFTSVFFDIQSPPPEA